MSQTKEALNEAVHRNNCTFTLYLHPYLGSMFNTIPIVILFFIFQRYFIEGAVGSAVKG